MTQAIRAELEIRCSRCDEISKVQPMERLGDSLFAIHSCPMCGREHDITLEVEWLEDR